MPSYKVPYDSSFSFDYTVLKAVKKILDEKKRRKDKPEASNRAPASDSVTLIYRANDSSVHGDLTYTSLPVRDIEDPNYQVPCYCGSGWNDTCPPNDNKDAREITHGDLYDLKTQEGAGGCTLHMPKFCHHFKGKEPTRCRSENPYLHNYPCFPCKFPNRCHVKSVDLGDMIGQYKTPEDSCTQRQENHHESLMSHPHSSSFTYNTNPCITTSFQSRSDGYNSPTEDYISKIDNFISKTDNYTEKAEHFIEDSVGKILHNYAQKNGICCQNPRPNTMFCINPLTYRSPRRSNFNPLYRFCSSNIDLVSEPSLSCGLSCDMSEEDRKEKAAEHKKVVLNPVYSSEEYELKRAEKRLDQLKTLLLMWRDLIEREEGRWKSVHGVDLSNSRRSNDKVIEYMINLC